MSYSIMEFENVKKIIKKRKTEKSQSCRGLNPDDLCDNSAAL